jgi:hypothetical protein
MVQSGLCFFLEPTFFKFRRSLNFVVEGKFVYKQLAVYKKSLEIPKGYSEFVNRRRLDRKMVKRKRTK